MKCFQVVAITGRSGSGKTAVSAHYAAQGYHVFDADRISRETTKPGAPCLAQLVEAFGADILDENGVLQRRVLAARVFADSAAVRTLTDITHPAIVEALLARIKKAKQTGASIVFVDGAVIVGEAFEPYCDRIIVVTAPLRDAVSRIVLRDGISRQAAYDRLGAQMPEEQLVAAADYVIHNNKNMDALLQRADEVLRQLRS